MSRSNHGNHGGSGGSGGHGGDGNNGGGGGNGGNGNHGNNCSPHGPPPGHGNNDGGDCHKAALISARADVDLDASASFFKGCNLVDVQAGLDADVGLDIGGDCWHA